MIMQREIRHLPPYLVMGACIRDQSDLDTTIGLNMHFCNSFVKYDKKEEEN
jgi:hypothetical protein